MMNTKDAHKIGTTTFRLWVRTWDAQREEWVAEHHSEHPTHDSAVSELFGRTGTMADITEVRWVEDLFDDEEYGQIRDAEGREIERWYFYSDGSRRWVADGSDRL